MPLTRPQRLQILAAAGFLPCILALWTIRDRQTLWTILLCSAVSAAGGWVTKAIIPVVKAATLRANLSGLDINKKGSEAGTKRIPESLGLAPGVVFLVCVILFQLLHYYDVASLLDAAASFGKNSSSSSQAISQSWLTNYNAALATICFMLFLGFADDVLDIPWRVKLTLPLLASLPLVVAYGDSTTIVIPKPFRSFTGFPEVLELGILYKVYMVMMAIFCTNAINILAGVNGLEAGQTFVISCAVLFLNITELGGPAGLVPYLRDGHLFSLYIMLPLATTTFGLLVFNWYPSQVFVGDTFTYFAGMAFAVAGILGHQTETMLLFFIPQILNFLYSVPQLFKLVPCPRHRLPRYDPQTGLLHATPNWNLVNLALQIAGPCSEQQLCVRILIFQAACCCVAFAARHALTGVYK